MAPWRRGKESLFLKEAEDRLWILVYGNARNSVRWSQRAFRNTFMASGTPANGPKESPAAMALSVIDACCNASCVLSARKLPMWGSALSSLSMYSCVISTALLFFWAKSRCISRIRECFPAAKCTWRFLRRKLCSTGRVPSVADNLQRMLKPDL